MSEHVQAPTPKAGGVSWSVWVSLGLWVFAAWQLFLLPPMTTAFKSFGIEAPGSAAFLSGIPAWLPLAIGVPLTWAFVSLHSCQLRTGVIALALISALCAHWANAALEL